MKKFLFLLPLLLSLHFPSPKSFPPPLTFAVGGDMLFDRLITKSYPGDSLYLALSQLKGRVFDTVDVGLINLEGPINASVLPLDPDPLRLVFNFPPQTVAALRYLGINGVSLANNHTGNAGLSGVTTTRRLLTDSLITSFGGPNPQDVYQIATFSGTNLNLVVIGVNTFTHFPDIFSLIKEIKSQSHNRVLVFPHWGIEYRSHFSSYQQKLAHSWIDAGADIVIGSHPHVIQDTEVYKNHPIIYSVGNLLFDQNFSPATQIGLVVNGTFSEEGLELSAVPIKAVKFQPTLLTDPDKQTVLNRFYQPLSSFLRTTPVGTVAFFPIN